MMMKVIIDTPGHSTKNLCARGDIHIRNVHIVVEYFIIERIAITPIDIALFNTPMTLIIKDAGKEGKR